MQIDTILLQQIEEICGGESVHLNANLVGAYRAAVEEFNRTGEPNYQTLAIEAHKELRILLIRMRERNGLFVRWE